MNARILCYNHIKNVTCATEQGSFPAINMLTDHRWQYMVTTGVIEHVIDVDFGGDEKRVRALALNHKLRAYDAIKMELFTNSSTAPADLLNDHTEQMMETIDDPDWHHTELAGDYLLDDREPTEKLYTYHGFDEVATNARITITQLGNLQMEANHIFVGDVIETETNITKRPASWFEDESEYTSNLNGDPFITKGALIHYLQIDWRKLTEHDRHRLILFTRRYGRRAKMTVCVRPDKGGYEEVLDQAWGYCEEMPKPVLRENHDGTYYTASMLVRSTYVHI